MLVSTDEKLGLDDELLEPEVPLDEPLVLEPEAALPDEDLSDEPDELLPDAAGADDEEPLPDAAGEDDEDELCATATLDSANSAAAVAALRTLSFSIRCLLEKGGGTCPLRDASRVPRRHQPAVTLTRRGLACSLFGRCSLRTPCLISADMRSVSSSLDSVNTRR